ncbi:MAG: hypothetical protein R2712_24295 [Vicinamibacterales bacterium]
MPQRIESFQEANAPMSIVMALDASGSMRQALEAVKAAATSFVTALRPTDPRPSSSSPIASSWNTSCPRGVS